MTIARTHAESVAKIKQLEAENDLCVSRAGEMSLRHIARIEELEAENARLTGLLDVAREALEFYAEKHPFKLAWEALAKLNATDKENGT